MNFEKIPPARAGVYAVLYVVFAFALVCVTTQNARAQAVPSFGGPILAVQECGCSGGWMMIVGPPVPGNYIFQFGVSQLFLAGQIYRPGPMVLGTYVPGGVCKPSTHLCTTQIPGNTILTVGTSL